MHVCVLGKRAVFITQYRFIDGRPIAINQNVFALLAPCFLASMYQPFDSVFDLTETDWYPFKEISS